MLLSGLVPGAGDGDLHRRLLVASHQSSPLPRSCSQSCALCPRLALHLAISQSLWFRALSQAAIPRPELLARLHEEGRWAGA